MEKVTGIDISKDDYGIENIIVNFINDNKEKISKNYSLDSDELRKIIESRKNEIMKKLPDLEIKNQKYKKWNFLLRIASGVFLAVLFISFVSLFMFGTSITIPSILSILFLAFAYFGVDNYGNNKNIIREERYNRDLENIEEILEEIVNNKNNNLKNIVQDVSFENIAKKSMIKITSISSKMMDFMNDFSLQAKKQVKNLYAVINDDLRRESTYNYNKQVSTNNNETLFQTTMRNIEYNETQRRRLDRKLDKLDDFVNIERGGRRR